MPRQCKDCGVAVSTGSQIVYLCPVNRQMKLGDEKCDFLNVPDETVEVLREHLRREVHPELVELGVVK